MSILTASGQFAISTGAATTTQAITGLGFTPYFILFMLNGQATATQQDLGTLDLRAVIGFATNGSAFGHSNDYRCVSNYSQNNVTPSVCFSGLRNDNCLATITSAGAWEGLASLNSFDASGFTVLINQAFPTAYLVNYFAIAGSEITNAIAGSYSLPGSGLVSVSTGFTPSMILGINAIDIATSENTVVSGSGFSFGVCSAPSNSDAGQQYSVTAASKTASATTVTHVATRNCFLQSLTGSGTIGSTQILQSWSSSGFIINPNPTTGSLKCYYVALQGGLHMVRQFKSSGITGVITDRPCGFRPTGALLFTDGDPSLDIAPVNGYELALGTVDQNLIQVCMAAKDIAAISPSKTLLVNTAPAVATNVANAAGLSMWDPTNAGGIKQQQSIGSFSTDGPVTIDVSNAGVTYWSCFWALGPAANDTVINPMASSESVSKAQRFVSKRSFQDINDQGLLPIIPTMEWDHDADPQLAVPFFVQDGDIADPSVETVPAPPPLIQEGWDTDAEQQSRQAPFFMGDGDLSDSGVELIILPPPVVQEGWDTDAEQQFQQTYLGDRDLFDYGLELITLPALPPLDQDIWADRAQAPYDIDRDILDVQVELITLPPLPPFDTDAEQQRQWMPYDTDRDLADSGVELITLPPLPPLDLDTFSDRSWASYDLDRDLAETFVERIQLPPLPPFDTDADWQPQVSKWPFIYDAEEDRQWTNLIILPPLVTKVQFWDTDAENQIPMSPYTVEAVEHQDRSNLVILPPLPPWDTDADQQRAHEVFVRLDDQERREGINFVILPPAPWVYELMDQLRQEGVGIPAQASDQGQDWQYLIILPPPVITQPFDTDADQQRQTADWAVEREPSAEFTQFIVYAPGVLTGWDTDADQQKPPFENFNKVAEEDRDRSVQVIIPPFVTKTNIDTDAENQLTNEVRFTDRMVEMQDRSNLIILPFLPPFDTDADSQFKHPEVVPGARQMWPEEWINSIIATLIRRGMALLYAAGSPQVWSLLGYSAPQVALAPSYPRRAVVEQVVVLGGGFEPVGYPTQPYLPSSSSPYGGGVYGGGSYGG